VVMNVAVWKCCAPAIRFFEVAKFATLTLLSLLASCRLSLPNLMIIMNLKCYFELLFHYVLNYQWHHIKCYL
jgi:hypothetical protein